MGKRAMWVALTAAFVAMPTAGVMALSTSVPSNDKDVCQHYSWTGGPLDPGEVPPRAPGEGWQANAKQEPHSDSGNKPATWVTGPPGLHYTGEPGNANWFDCVAIEPEPSQSPSPSVTPTDPEPSPSGSATGEGTPTPTVTPTVTPSASGSPRTGTGSPSPSETTPTPDGSATPDGTPDPSTPVASPTPTGRSTEPSTRRDGPRPKSTPTATPAKPKTPVTPKPKCSDVAKEQAGKTYAKDSPQAVGIRCAP